MYTSKFRQNLEILNGCNSETIQVQGLKFHANSSLRVRYVLTKFRQNRWQVSIFRVDLTWNDPPYSGKFSRGSIFVGGRSLLFHEFNFCGRKHSRPLYTVQSSFFVGLIFMLGRSSAKTTKFDPLKISCYTVLIWLSLTILYLAVISLEYCTYNIGYVGSTNLVEKTFTDGS